MAYATSSNADALTTWLNKKFIPDLMYEVQWQPFTEKAIIPPQSGNIGRFLVWNLPTAATTNLSEGTTTQGEVTFSGIGTNITVVEWGQHLKTTELMMYAAVKGAREKLSKRLRDGAALTLDSRIRDVAAGTTVAAYTSAAAAGASTTAAIPTAGNAAALIFCRKLLRDAKVPPFEGVPGHPNRHYAAILSPQYEMTMVQEVSSGRVTWTEMVKNVPGAMGQEKMINGYLGSVYGVACYVTQNYSQTTITSLSDNNYVIGDGGVGAMGFDQMNPRIIINDVNSPYKNIDSVAWHAQFQAALIESVRVVRLYSNAV